MNLNSLTERAKLLLSVVAIMVSGAIWLALSLIGVELSFLMFAVLTLFVYFVILALRQRKG